VSGLHAREVLREGGELALLDVRTERLHATGHPLFAASFPRQRLEAMARDLLPRRDVPIVVFGAGDDQARDAVATLAALGFRDVAELDSGLSGWTDGGGELFADVNAPSKAFGELVASAAGTPSLAADEVHRLLAAGADLALVDARPFDEHRTMTVPGSRSVPGAELVARADAFAPDPATTIVVHCAGRTRSIIGAQSLIDAGVPNRVVALRNGTIGWSLAGLEPALDLDHSDRQQAGPLLAQCAFGARIDPHDTTRRLRVAQPQLEARLALRLRMEPRADRLTVRGAQRCAAYG